MLGANKVGKCVKILNAHLVLQSGLNKKIIIYDRC